jgi:hypothetical protein
MEVGTEVLVAVEGVRRGRHFPSREAFPLRHKLHRWRNISIQM